MYWSVGFVIVLLFNSKGKFVFRIGGVFPTKCTYDSPGSAADIPVYFGSALYGRAVRVMRVQFHRRFANPMPAGRRLYPVGSRVPAHRGRRLSGVVRHAGVQTPVAVCRVRQKRGRARCVLADHGRGPPARVMVPRVRRGHVRGRRAVRQRVPGVAAVQG